MFGDKLALVAAILLNMPSAPPGPHPFPTAGLQGHPEATDGATGRSITEAFLNHAADQIALGVRMGKTPEWASQWVHQQVRAGRMVLPS